MTFCEPNYKTQNSLQSQLKRVLSLSRFLLSPLFGAIKKVRSHQSRTKQNAKKSGEGHGLKGGGADRIFGAAKANSEKNASASV